MKNSQQFTGTQGFSHKVWIHRPNTGLTHEDVPAVKHLVGLFGCVHAIGLSCLLGVNAKSKCDLSQRGEHRFQVNLQQEAAHTPQGIACICPCNQRRSVLPVCNLLPMLRPLLYLCEYIMKNNPRPFTFVTPRFFAFHEVETDVVGKGSCFGCLQRGEVEHQRFCSLCSVNNGGRLNIVSPVVTKSSGPLGVNTSSLTNTHTPTHAKEGGERKSVTLRT